MSKRIITLWGKPYAIYSSPQYNHLFNFSGYARSESTMIMWMIHPGSEIKEILDSGEERCLGIVNAECLRYAKEKTYGMECGNPIQYEEIIYKKIEAVFEFLRSDAYLFSFAGNGEYSPLDNI